MPPDKLLTVVAPSNPHFKVATEKGWTYLTWMAVFSEGRWGQPERNNFEVGGHGGIPRLNLQFYRMAVFYEEPGISPTTRFPWKLRGPISLTIHHHHLGAQIGWLSQDPSLNLQLATMCHDVTMASWVLGVFRFCFGGGGLGAQISTQNVFWWSHYKVFWHSAIAKQNKTNTPMHEFGSFKNPFFLVKVWVKLHVWWLMFWSNKTLHKAQESLNPSSRVPWISRPPVLRNLMVLRAYILGGYLW